MISFTLLMKFFVSVAFLSLSSSVCPIDEKTIAIYSTVNGVCGGCQKWVEDFLWWWKSGDSSLNYVAMTANDFETCNLAEFLNLRFLLNPGGDAYNQLIALGVKGATNIKNFITRDQGHPSAYIGFCAGTYLVSHDYIWGNIYEGLNYYAFKTTPPLSLFPHTVEGSIIDINDLAFGDQYGSYSRMVNVSNGHQMLYFGGSTFGYNAVEDYTNPTSPSYDSNIEVLLYYSDFYGFYSKNIPAAWRYKNLLLTSVHPEADNCTSAAFSDCLLQNTISEEMILKNWAWLVYYINLVAGTSLARPSVPTPPALTSSAFHVAYAPKACYAPIPDSSVKVLFCDGFDSSIGEVPYGLSMQFQRNNSYSLYAKPWNTSYISSWKGTTYTTAQSGDGYAMCVPSVAVASFSSITTQYIDVSKCTLNKKKVYTVDVSYFYKGNTATGGYLSVIYSTKRTNSNTNRWTAIASHTMNSANAWKLNKKTLSVSQGVGMLLQFKCAAGSASNNYCAVDTISVSCS